MILVIFVKAHLIPSIPYMTEHHALHLYGTSFNALDLS